jgi:hypothetical protein
MEQRKEGSSEVAGHRYEELLGDIAVVDKHKDY